MENGSSHTHQKYLVQFVSKHLKHPRAEDNNTRDRGQQAGPYKLEWDARPFITAFVRLLSESSAHVS
jgi:hypothetical protein